MKRETRPFVVEVRRGSKKQNTPFLPPPPEESHADPSLQRAEEMLFSRDRGPEGSAAPRGRILESVAEPTIEAEPPVESEAPPAPGRRRGRPPGSKNAPPQDRILAGGAEGQKPTRGRPRAAAGVRRLELTPELVDAAMATITKVALTQAATQPRAGSESAADADASPSASHVYARLTPSSDLGGDQLEFMDGLFDVEAAEPKPSAPPVRTSARRPPVDLAGADLQSTDLRRLFKPGERWRGRMMLRGLARRRRA
jgi:hypothetical protein